MVRLIRESLPDEWLAADLQIIQCDYKEIVELSKVENE